MKTAFKVKYVSSCLKTFSCQKLSQILECAFKRQQTKKHSFAIDQKRAKKKKKKIKSLSS